MHKTRTAKYEVEETIHQFYCDVCDEFLGESQEYEDGYYEKHGEYEIKFYMEPTKTWYHLKKCLCKTCRDKFNTRLTTQIEEMGFKKDF